uniref:Single-stranded DNA binding protein n=1 Tax=Izziella formosana TaxID=1653389 RepID=A0A1G4NUR9_9FLOR|nr:Hypothetical protein ycf41 [Izziella formosana]SCW22354.1 Hypothetical protein ycf41 [Izziella formosana]
MQINVLTVQISTKPQKQLEKASITFFAKVLNAARGEPYYYMKATAWGDSGRNIINLYSKGDYIIVENYITYAPEINANILVITREHPIFLPD